MLVITEWLGRNWEASVIKWGLVTRRHSIDVYSLLSCDGCMDAYTCPSYTILRMIQLKIHHPLKKKKTGILTFSPSETVKNQIQLLHPQGRHSSPSRKSGMIRGCPSLLSPWVTTPFWQSKLTNNLFPAHPGYNKTTTPNTNWALNSVPGTLFNPHRI